jgi:heme ABC exporter ATP-binding subunit CcmA
VAGVASGAIIHFRAAVALLDGFPALAGADFDVDSGEVVLLQGPNGAGKSTLLRACAGLVAVVSGEAIVLGCDLQADRRAVRRRVGLLGHATFLYDDLSVRENVAFAVRASGAASDTVAPALARLGLDGRLANVEAGRLSAGQRRRVAVAVLVARRPELWLLDEPHAGLDAEGRELVDGLIAEAVNEGSTVVLASHEVDRAGSLASRILHVAGGQVFGAPLARETEQASAAPGVPAHVA